jgi:hypothetical protein
MLPRDRTPLGALASNFHYPASFALPDWRLQLLSAPRRAKVDVALSKALRATDAQKFRLEEIENLGKAMKCKSIELLICSVPG